MTTDAQALLSAENQQVLLFTLAADSTDHPPERVAAYLGGSVGTLSNWRNTGAGPKFRKVGGKVMYRKSDVMAWVDSNPAVTSLTELSRLQAGQSPRAA